MPILPRSSISRLLVGLVCMVLSFGSSVGAEGPYRIGAKDVLSIQVWNRPELSRSVTVDLDGTILLPALDKPVAAKDRTETELATELTRLYLKFYPDIPEVVVKVEDYKSRSVTVSGEVRAPANYGFPVIPDLYQVLIKAGYPTPQADLSQVRIVRKGEGDQGTQIITVDMSAMSRGEAPKSLPPLLPDDTIIVPPIVSGATGTVAGAKFQVLGSVRTPGVYPWTDTQTVSGALALSGGPLPDADLRKVYLTRATPKGVVSYKLDVKALLYEGKTDADLDLQEGDTLTIPAKSFGAGSVGRGLLLFVPLITSLVSLVVVIDNNQ